MTVLEIIKKFELEDFDKYYKNAFGEPRDLAFKFEELKNMEVKGVDINFPTGEVTITLQTIR